MKDIQVMTIAQCSHQNNSGQLIYILYLSRSNGLISRGDILAELGPRSDVIGAVACGLLWHGGTSIYVHSTKISGR